MNITRHAKLFRNGRSQAVRIPREFEFSGDEVIIRRDGSRLTIEPAAKSNAALIALLDSLEPLDEELPVIERGPPRPVDL